MITTPRPRQYSKIQLKMTDGSAIFLSQGIHNQLQNAVVEEFGPRFAPGASLLRFESPASKDAVFDGQELTKLNFSVKERDKLPDIILYMPERNWLFLIETVNRQGPVTPKRRNEIETLLSGCPSWRVYVTAFLDVKRYRKYAGEIAWETHVWIAENPDHMIHYNSSELLGPYTARE